MKNFKYPLIIRGTKEQLESLIPNLEKLGYCQYMDMNYHDGSNYCLVTNAYRRNGDLQFFKSIDEDCERTEVSASNPDLVLALAACVDDNDAYVGEYWIVDKKLVKITDVRQKDGWFVFEGIKDPTNYHNSSFHHHRKATKQEIINHFTPKTMEKKIIGYKLKDDCKQYEKAALKIGGFSSLKLNEQNINLSSLGDPNEPTQLYINLKESGVLNLWFEPVYEEKYSFKKGDWVIGWHSGWAEMKKKAWQINHVNDSYAYPITGGSTGIEDIRLATPEEIAAAQTKVITLRCEGGTFEIEVSKKGIYYAPETCFSFNYKLEIFQ